MKQKASEQTKQVIDIFCCKIALNQKDFSFYSRYKQQLVIYVLLCII